MSINIHLLKVKHGELYDFTLENLANMEIPDFRNANTHYDTFRGYMPLFDGFLMDDEALQYFQQEITKRSEGRVSLVAQGHDSEIQGPAQRLELVRGDERLQFTLGPYAQSHAFMKK